MPQVPVGVQDQSTPAFVVSFVTVALTVAVPLVCRDAGGLVVMEMVTPPVDADTVTGAVAVAECEVVEVATIVTLAAVAGAVYVVFAPLAVCAGLNVPHAAVGVQLQSTPAFALSFVTVALTVAVALVANVVGGFVVIDTLTVDAAETVTVAEATTVCEDVEVAVIVAVPAAVGAVYVVVPPLAV